MSARVAGAWTRVPSTIKPVVVMYVASGGVAVANALVEEHHPRSLWLIVGLGVVDVAVGLVVAWLPWERWPGYASLALVPFSLVLIQVFAWAHVLHEGTYPVFFVLLFIWVGLAQPPRSALYLAPLTAFAYVAPVWTGAPVPDVVESAGLVVPVCILIGEVISRTSRDARDAERRAADLQHETSRAARERALREEAHENAQRLAAVIEQIPGTVWTTDTRLRLLSGDGNAPVTVEDGDELYGVTVGDLYDGASDSSPVPAHLKALEGETAAFETEFAGVVLRGSVAPRRDSEGRIVGTVGVALDVTEEARARDTARVQAALLAESPASTIVTTLRGQVTYWSPASERLFLYAEDEAVGRDVFDLLVLPEDEALAADVFATAAAGGKWSGEWNVRRRDGETIWIWVSLNALRDAAGGISGVLGAAFDITHRKLLEKQLLQAQRLESVGQLAGGVAHDFNNLLAVIISYTELLLEDLEPGDRRRDDLKLVLDAGHKGASLTRQLLTFARREISMPRVLDLNDVVEGMERLLERALDGGVDVVFRLGDPPPVRIDPGQLEQVIMNLAVNANDAMPHGGILLVETATAVLDEGRAEAHCIEPGRYAKLTVTDEGIGMPREVRERIFEPFYTTKGPGGGTGLGLPTVHGIVTKSGGGIEVDSRPGRGATFAVYLPAASAAADLADATGPPPPAPRGRRELILVAEDEDAVRGVIERVLTGNGYRVMTASSGPDAIELARRAREPIDLLLTDVVMPKMTGKALAEALGLKTIFVSGYTQQIVTEKGMLQEGRTLIQKPFSARHLLEVVRAALDAGDDPAGEQQGAG